MDEVKCAYCYTAPNNLTTKKGLKVCCCYMLHKRGNTYIQHYRNRKPTYVTNGVITMSNGKVRVNGTREKF